MQKLRSLHLYLGCIFAPMLLFFALSGIWQTLRLRSPLLDRLSTIHTEVRLKNGSELSSTGLRLFAIIMAASFIVTTILGVIMALKFGRSRKVAYWCLAFGVVAPLTLVLIRVFQ